MSERKIENLVFNELHRAIHESAESVLNFDSSTVSYPPGVEFSDEEKEALSKLELSAATKSALRKLLIDACSYPSFHLFSLLDGVTEPVDFDGEAWLGGKLVQSSDEEEEDTCMLHEEFYNTYWDSTK